MSFLLADSGSSKAEWRFLNGNKNISFRTSGLNPYFFTTSRLARTISQELVPQLQGEIPDEIFFYGAGCAAEDRRVMMTEALRSAFQKSPVEVNDDLLGAARGLLQHISGFIAILGTGMNNGFYDGEKITQQVDSLGFILGDEGSGTAIGKRLLKSFLRKEFPEMLIKDFENEFNLTRDDILNSVYSGIEANRFIAGFARFAGERKSDVFVRDLIKSSFIEFFEKIITRFPSYKNNSFNCVGSVGFFFSEILTEVSEQFGMKTRKILQSPMEGLVKFHSENEKANH